MDYLQSLILTVNKSHLGLGELIAMEQIAIKARKMMLSVSPSGCGKSRATDWVKASTPNQLTQGRLSTAQLGSLADALTNFSSCLFIDDLAQSGSDYARNMTVTTLAELCYSGEAHSVMAKSEYDIFGFKGSIIANIQPVLLRNLVTEADWDASVKDKTIRYYHLRRPTKPNLKVPEFTIGWGKNFDDIAEPRKIPKSLVTLGRCEWSSTRVVQHVTDLLKAVAALNSHFTVTLSDQKLLETLLRPLAIESLVLAKLEFESDRQLDNNALAILTEYYSYGGEFTLSQIADDYSLSETRARAILSMYSDLWVDVGTGLYRPSIAMEQKMNELGVLYVQTNRKHTNKNKHK